MDILATATPLSDNDRSKILADLLGEEIVEGILQPGQKLNELGLAERFRTSRGPVREALRRLSERGLVTFAPNAGARVQTYSIADFLHIIQLRETLEVRAAELSARMMSAGQKAQLRTLFDEHRAAVSAHPDGAYFQGREDRDFHFLIAIGSANPFLERLLCDELYSLLRMCRRLHGAIHGRGERALEEHRRVLVAIEEGDAELAGLMMRRHIAAAREAVESHLESIAVGGEAGRP